jgi:glucose 1-dehydrogenase
MLKGKVAVVTGSTSGIGLGVARALAAQGAAVMLNGFGPAGEIAEIRGGLERVSGAKAAHHPADMSKPAEIAKLIEAAESKLGAVDVLVNNAGIQISRPSDALSSEDFDKVLAVNLRGAFLCAREAIRHFLAENKPGVIINVSSVHQLIPKPDYLGYSTSKGGMQNLTRTLALEYAARGIRVNAIGPGATVTPINRAWIDDPVKREMVESHIPMRRAGTADEMGAVACFLASDNAGYITGQTIFVDGGLTLFPSFREPWSSE